MAYEQMFRIVYEKPSRKEELGTLFYNFFKEEGICPEDIQPSINGNRVLDYYFRGERKKDLPPKSKLEKIAKKIKESNKLVIRAKPGEIRKR